MEKLAQTASNHTNITDLALLEKDDLINNLSPSACSALLPVLIPEVIRNLPEISQSINIICSTWTRLLDHFNLLDLTDSL